MLQAKREWKLMAGVVVALVLSFAAAAHSQVTTADIVGTITDKSNAVVPNAKVTATNVATGLSRSTRTDSGGEYAFTALQIGTYSVSVEAQGFKKFTAPNVSLSTGDRIRVNAQMEVGQVSETIEVQSAAPAIQTDSASVGSLVNEQSVQQLPLNGRNFMKLAQLVAGANEGSSTGLTSGTRPDDRRQSSSISANGQQDTLNNRTIDGMDNNERIIGTIGVQPSIEAIQEVKVQTNLYTAEVGRTAGVVVDVVTKAGTNNLHGSIYEYLRNDIFDARDYFNRTAIGPKPPYHLNQFGGSLGGPIKKDKTFFFADYEGLRISRGLTVPLGTVPTACELGRAACNGVQQLGNFSDLTTPIFDPATKAPFAGNIIPAGRLNQVSSKFASLYPSPNLPGLSNNFVTSLAQTQLSHTSDARVDHHFNEANSVSARYTINDVTTSTPGTFPSVSAGGITINPGGDANGSVNQFAGVSAERAQNVAGNFTHIFSPSLLLELTAGYLRVNINTTQLNYGTNAAQALGLNGINVNGDSSGLPLINLDGYSNLGDDNFIPLRYSDNAGQYNVNLTWVRGAHTFKVGQGLIRRYFGASQSQFPEGNFVFRTATAGNSFASFLLGNPAQEQRNLVLNNPEYRTWEPNAYMQDYWRVRPWLTLTLGLRYDIFTPWTESNDQLSNFNPVNGTLFLASSSNPTAGVLTDYSNWAPRIGFAASISSNTVIRGGFGMSFFPTNTGSQFQLKNPPFSSNFGLSGNGAALVWTSPLPPAVANSITNPAGQIFGIDPHYRSAYVYQSNLMVQHDWSGNVVTLGWVGEFSRRINVNPDINMVNTPGPQPAGTPILSAPNPAQPYHATVPLVTTITMAQSEGSANHNALEASFEHRYKSGLTLSTNFTWAHTLDDVAGNAIGVECPFVNCIVDNGNGSTSTVNGLQYDYGNADLDIPLRWALAVDYQIPFGRSLKGVERAVLQGWQINSIASWESGYPILVREAANQAQTTGLGNSNVGGSRPNQVADPVISNPSPALWFNTKAFALQRLGTLGNARRNQLFGPPQRHWDFSFFKNFPIRESLSLQFRTEIFNLTNTPNFNNPPSVLGGAGFGVITSTTPGSTPRQFQFALKALF